jgi:hypothetical protein
MGGTPRIIFCASVFALKVSSYHKNTFLFLVRSKISDPLKTIELFQSNFLRNSLIKIPEFNNLLTCYSFIEITWDLFQNTHLVLQQFFKHKNGEFRYFRFFWLSLIDTIRVFHTFFDFFNGYISPQMKF